MATKTTSSTVETQLPETAWQSKTVEEQTAFLVPLIGKRVRYVNMRDYIKGRRVFGPHYPMPWREMRLSDFEVMGGDARDPGVTFNTGRTNLLGQCVTSTVGFDAIYDIEAMPEEPAKDGPDYDGADVYEADEVVCPHCGEKLRIVQRATVEKATPADSES